MDKIKLLNGSSPDIISTNVNALKETGHSHAHATHLAMKHSYKSSKSNNSRSQVPPSLVFLKAGS